MLWVELRVSSDLVHGCDEVISSGLGLGKVAPLETIFFFVLYIFLDTNLQTLYLETYLHKI